MLKWLRKFKHKHQNDILLCLKEQNTVLEVLESQTTPTKCEKCLKTLNFVKIFFYVLLSFAYVPKRIFVELHLKVRGPEQG